MNILTRNSVLALKKTGKKLGTCSHEKQARNSVPTLSTKNDLVNNFSYISSQTFLFSTQVQFGHSQPATLAKCGLAGFVYLWEHCSELSGVQISSRVFQHHLNSLFTVLLDSGLLTEWVKFGISHSVLHWPRSGWKVWEYYEEISSRHDEGCNSQLKSGLVWNLDDGSWVPTIECLVKI